MPEACAATFQPSSPQAWLEVRISSGWSPRYSVDADSGGAAGAGACPAETGKRHSAMKLAAGRIQRISDGLRMGSPLTSAPAGTRDKYVNHCPDPERSAYRQLAVGVRLACCW